MLEAQLEQLRAQGLRITRPRRAILVALEACERPVSVEDLRAQLDEQAPDLATIYRTLDALLSCGAVHRVDLGEGYSRWELARLPEHEHLVCTRCGAVECVEIREIGALLRAIEERQGFRVERCRLELSGVCRRCLGA